DAQLLLERYSEDQSHIEAALRFLAPEPDIRVLSGDKIEQEKTELTEKSSLFSPLPPVQSLRDQSAETPKVERETGLVLLTNGIGGMARLHVNLGDIKSKYDCALAANLHTHVPVDRHVFVKRLRAWVVADG